MKFKLPEEQSKNSLMRSNTFGDDVKVTCEFHGSRQFDMHLKHKRPENFAIKKLGIIEECLDLIVPNDHPDNSIVNQLKELEDDLTWVDHADAKNKICELLKKHWEDIDGFEPEYFVYDKLRSRFDISISLDTTYKQIKCLDESVIEKWAYTVYTPYGLFEIY